MIDGIASAGRMNDAARPAAPGAPGRGIGEGRERAAERGFAALLDGPPESAGEAEAESAAPDLLPESQENAVLDAAAQPAAVAKPDEGRPCRDKGEEPEVAVEPWSLAAEGVIDLDGLALSADPAWPEEMGGSTGGLGPVGGVPEGGVPGTVAPEGRLRAQERGDAVVGAGRDQGAAKDASIPRPVGLTGASRAESVLAALVASQPAPGPSAAEPGMEFPAGPPGPAMSPSASSGSASALAGALAAREAGAGAGKGLASAEPGSKADFGAASAVATDGGEVRGSAPSRGEGQIGPVMQRFDAPPPPDRWGGVSGPASPVQKAARRLGESLPAASPDASSAGSREVGRGAGRPDFAAKAPSAGPVAGEGGERWFPGLEQTWPGDRGASPMGAIEPGRASSPPDGPQTARQVARQVADHPVLRTGGAAEMSLDPEELGPLRLTVEGTDGALRVVIEAARPETADLLRRHVEALRQELRQEGLGSVGVSIGGGDSRQGGEAGGRSASPLPDHPGAASGAAPAASLAPPAARGRTPAGQLDLRF